MIRKPAVSGSFYPSNAERLSSDVKSYLNSHSQRKTPGELLGLIAPHAGYMYSGLTAGAAYALLVSEHYETAVIIAPNHQQPFKGVSVYEGDAYQTPLGLVSVDQNLRENILALSNLIFTSLKGHEDEHAIEVQVPFLQIVQPGIRIVPIVIGQRSLAACLEFGALLASVIDPARHILIASSDLSHYHPENQAAVLDARAARSIKENDPLRFAEQLASGKSEACGGGPIATVMMAAKLLGCTKSDILHQCTSGDTSGDYSRVVGYLSAAFWKTR